MKKVLFAFGTRPEAVKMAPLIAELRRRQSAFAVRVCVTAQHRQMLDQVLAAFSIVPEYDLDVMQLGQSLPSLTARILEGFDAVLCEAKPNIVIVQGDTATTVACALAAFYRKIPVAHLEAGLRTNDRLSPFPEEVNRRLTAILSDWHFAPTERARQALLEEGFPRQNVFVTGNTVVDALMSVVTQVREKEARYGQLFPFLADGREMVLITGHRRESFGAGIEQICAAVRCLADANPAVAFLYTVHLNPNVEAPVTSALNGLGNVHLLPPQDYAAFVWLMDRATLLLTDSGGVQEEAVSLNKPVVVMRDRTERVEAVSVGAAVLVGTATPAIIDVVNTLLHNPEARGSMVAAENPFGDGHAAVHIAQILADTDG